MYLCYRADAAIRWTSSFLETANDVTSPSLAFMISVMMHCVSERLDFFVPCCAPFARLPRATSSLLDGDESTAFGWDTAPNRILVISSIGAA